jgi:hypothetical protein
MSRQSPHARSRAILLALAVVAAPGCAAGGGSSAVLQPATNVLPARSATARWIPAAGATFQVEYQWTGSKLDTSSAASIYDIDMFDATKAMVSQLHALGRRAVCYIDVGTWENWRPDAKKFPKKVLGKPDGGWAGEKWLDIRQTAILEPIMTARFALCKSKGFDGVEADNIDGYQNATGFPLTAAEQLTYDEWVAQAVHAQGLAVAQKNDNAQFGVLSTYFDFAVDEQCYIQGWCKQLQAYTDRNALAVDVEYTPLSQQRFLAKTCPSDAAYRVTGILKHLSVYAWIVPCPSR